MSIDLIEAFKQFNHHHGFLSSGRKLLLAVSGGPDSVVLCSLCDRLGFDFSIAHCNFKLRGEESDADAAFVGKLAEQYGVPFLLKEFDTKTYANDQRMGMQEAARKLRYDWFRQLLSDPGHSFDWLLTAHHADDNIETLLMNFFKGTGIKGLQGIPYRNDKILRPLLFAYREDIMGYADAHSIAFRSDSSNESIKYTRNYFRLELIPSIEKVFPAVRNNLIANIGRFSDMAWFYEKSLADARKKLLVKKNNDCLIPLKKLASHPALRTMVFEIIREFGFTAHQSDEVIKMLNAQSGKYIDSATHRLLINRNWIVISPLQKEIGGYHHINEQSATYTLADGKLKTEVRAYDGHIQKDARIAQLDLSLLKFPLLLRPWRPGDYFYPLGMRKKKKISRFLTDAKLSLQEKEKVMVLESEGRIHWVAGLRVDDRFKVTAATKNIFQLSVQ